MIKKFGNNFFYELFDFDNKITKDKYDKMHKILIVNENIITKKDNSSKEMYDKWVNMILNTKDYNILLCYKAEELVGFIAFMYLDIGLMLSEVQVKKEYQGKEQILKNMLKELLKISDKSKYNYIYGTIDNNNIKSIDVFTHIGFKN